MWLEKCKTMSSRLLLKAVKLWLGLSEKVAWYVVLI